MFASQLSEIMSAVLRISKKYPDMEVPIQRYGTPMPDKILAHMLEDLDSRLDKAQAEIERLKSAPAEVRTGEL